MLPTVMSQYSHSIRLEWAVLKPVMPVSLQRKFIKWPKLSLISFSSRRCDPVQIFPLEIVWMIFQHVLDADKNCWRRRRILSLVSKSWRNAVYTNPLFWQFIKFDFGSLTPAHLRVLDDHIIHRSQNVPLFVTISTTTEPKDKSYKFPKAAIHSILSQNSRIRILSLKFPRSPPYWKPNIEGQFSHLEKLKLNCACSGFMSYIFENITPMQLTYLALINGGTSVQKIYNILAACGNLQSMRIIFGIPHFGRPVLPPRFPLLPPGAQSIVAGHFT